MASVVYTDQQRIHALATLAANGGNLQKTSTETGISREALRAWQATPLANSPEVQDAKKLLSERHFAQLESTRDAALSKIRELIAKSDGPEYLRDVVGAFKIVNEAIAEQRLLESVAQAIELETEARRRAAGFIDVESRELNP